MLTKEELIKVFIDGYPVLRNDEYGLRYYLSPLVEEGEIDKAFKHKRRNKGQTEFFPKIKKNNEILSEGTKIKMEFIKVGKFFMIVNISLWIKYTELVGRKVSFFLGYKTFF